MQKNIEIIKQEKIAASDSEEDTFCSDNFMMPFVDRYFVKYYKTIIENEKNLSQFLFLHSNKLFMIGLSNKHKIIQEKLKISKISFDCAYTGDLNNLVKGKKKKGGIKINPMKQICTIFCENGEIFKPIGLIQGHIIEFNENLIKEPQLIEKYSHFFILLENPKEKDLLLL